MLAEPAHGAPDRLPARRVDAPGRVRVDGRAIVALALPLFVNSSLQAVLNLTDTWFIGRISAQAVAAVGGVYWIVLGALLLLGGVGMVVQAFAAQAYGGGRRRRAALAAWSGLWASLALVPVFAAIAWAGPWVVPWLGLPPELQAMSLEYWGPRMLGGGAAVALWSVLSFFNGVGHVRRALAINMVVAVLNAGLNQWLMFDLGLGVAGSAWATTLSICVGLAIAMAMFLGPPYRRRYASARMWRPRLRSIVATVNVGLPVGLSIAFDILGLAAFQAMLTRLGAVPGAASQIVMMLTSIAYMPAVGLGMAGTTLVGQSIGAGDRDWARRVGDRTIVLSVGYMFVTGFVLAIAAFAISAQAQGLIDAESTRLAAAGLGPEAARWPSVVWQLVAYVVITAAEILVSITCLEFSYTQAPPQMKSFVMSLYLLSVSLGNLFTAAVNMATRDGSGNSTLSGASYYWFFTGCMAVATLLLVPVVLLYRSREYLQPEADAPAPRSH